jgi:hypothetical protein
MTYSDQVIGKVTLAQVEAAINVWRTALRAHQMLTVCLSCALKHVRLPTSTAR